MALADELRAMHARGELLVTIGRASDFFGPGLENTTLIHARAIAQLLAGQTVDVIGDIDQPHSWRYAPDVAEGLLELGLHPELGGVTLHLPVLPAQTGRSMLTALAAALQVPLQTRQMPGWMLKVARIFSPLMRELPEMQYQFSSPFVMSDARIRGPAADSTDAARGADHSDGGLAAEPTRHLSATRPIPIWCGLLRGVDSRAIACLHGLVSRYFVILQVRRL